MGAGSDVEGRVDSFGCRRRGIGRILLRIRVFQQAERVRTRSFTWTRGRVVGGSMRGYKASNPRIQGRVVKALRGRGGASFLIENSLTRRQGRDV